MNRKKISTYEREMQKASFRKKFEKEYQDFLLSELIISLMENDHKSVRGLAKEVGLSPTVIQNLRSGIQTDLKLSNFINISHACGYQILLEKNGETIHL